MRTKISWTDGVALVVLFLPLAYFIYLYPGLPQTVALHFNVKGEPDRWGNKSETWLPILMLSVVALGVGLLVRFLPLIDPKKKVQYSEGTLIKLSYGLVLFLTVLNFMIVHASQTGHFALGRGFFPVMGLFYVYLGNLFNNIKPNYFVGIRTPWTLENESVWRKTHHWGGRLWVIGGLTLAVTTFFWPKVAVFLTGTAILALAPIIYSYVCYRQIQKTV
ncbi:SdpI family protein [Dinghuibacter silviterrae]|uniref:Putative membrane protein n=1 Tax=Dinghuibacter silviterrae TaxID=1539049 RepID=A0A4R8DJP0_9BACT|nr:SdpI family protein [Dinghuibacter silviterrae]TDW97534.1 putative membrane protein [Dinghuibacter silviterrae]